MSALVVDIETAGEDWSTIDEQTKELLVKRVTDWRAEAGDEAEATAIDELGFSPFTGQIVALGVLDCDTEKGAVYYQAPGKEIKDQEIDGIKLCRQTEKELLEKFWQLSDRYSHFVTYGGRAFDIPYIMIRSAINGIRPAKDLMRGRYLYQQGSNAINIDLYDQFKFYGAIRGIGGLHLACRAFGIKTPKDGLIDGAKVPEYFKSGRYQEIAEYNARDLRATKELYEKWQKFLAF